MWADWRGEHTNTEEEDKWWKDRKVEAHGRCYPTGALHSEQKFTSKNYSEERKEIR